MAHSPELDPTHWIGDGCAYHGLFEEVALAACLTAREISDQLGVPVDRVKSWVKNSSRTGFPKPVWQFPTSRYPTNLFHWPEVQAWYEAWRSKPAVISANKRVAREAGAVLKVVATEGELA